MPTHVGNYIGRSQPQHMRGEWQLPKLDLSKPDWAKERDKERSSSSTKVRTDQQLLEEQRMQQEATMAEKRERLKAGGPAATPEERAKAVPTFQEPGGVAKGWDLQPLDKNAPQAVSETQFHGPSSTTLEFSHPEPTTQAASGQRSGVPQIEFSHPEGEETGPKPDRRRRAKTPAFQEPGGEATGGKTAATTPPAGEPQVPPPPQTETVAPAGKGKGKGKAPTTLPPPPQELVDAANKESAASRQRQIPQVAFSNPEATGQVQAGVKPPAIAPTFMAPGGLPSKPTEGEGWGVKRKFRAEST